MPGHMNVLLAEAEVDYEKLLELGIQIPRSRCCHRSLEHATLICPAANDPTMDTPLSGMPFWRLPRLRPSLCVRTTGQGTRSGKPTVRRSQDHHVAGRCPENW